MRERLLAQTGDAALVARVAPLQPGEAEAAARARTLFAAAARAADLERPPSFRVGRPAPPLVLGARTPEVIARAGVAAYARGGLGRAARSSHPQP